MSNYAQFCAGEITREDFIDKLKYYCAKDRWYADHGFYGDAISKDLREGGLSLLVPSDMPDSLEKVFQHENLPTYKGLSTALRGLAKMYGVGYYDDAMYREYVEKNRFDDELSRLTGAFYLRQHRLDQSSVGENRSDSDGYQSPVKGFDAGKSIAFNTGAELTNKPYAMLSDRGVGGVPLKVFTKANGVIGMVSVGLDLKEDAEKYHGTDFAKAVVIDTGGTVAGGVAVAGLSLGIGMLGAPVIVSGFMITGGAILIGIGTDFAKDVTKVYFLPSESSK